MTKRLLSLALVVTMLFSSAIAFATNNSITIDDPWYDIEVIIDDESEYNSADGGLGGDTWYITFRDELLGIKTEFALDVLEAIEDFLKGDKVINFFDEDTKASIAALLPPGFDLKKLNLYEFTSLKEHIDTIPSRGAEVQFGFPTSFKKGKAVVAVIGVLLDDGTIKWMPLETKVMAVIKNGKLTYKLRVKFTKEALQFMKGNPEIMLAILGEPI